jgi:hypothetical protein
MLSRSSGANALAFALGSVELLRNAANDPRPQFRSAESQFA